MLREVDWTGRAQRSLMRRDACGWASSWTRHGRSRHQPATQPNHHDAQQAWHDAHARGQGSEPRAAGSSL